MQSHCSPIKKTCLSNGSIVSWLLFIISLIYEWPGAHTTKSPLKSKRAQLFWLWISNIERVKPFHTNLYWSHDLDCRPKHLDLNQISKCWLLDNLAGRSSRGVSWLVQHLSAMFNKGTSQNNMVNFCEIWRNYTMGQWSGYNKFLLFLISVCISVYMFLFLSQNR